MLDIVLIDIDVSGTFKQAIAVEGMNTLNLNLMDILPTKVVYIKSQTWYMQLH